MGLEVARSVINAIHAEAQATHPRECCGILLGDGKAIDGLRPAANVHPQPETHFEIDPQTLIDAHRAERQGGPQVMGYYHSHPTSAAEPSDTDRASAAHDDLVWAIIGEGKVTFWRDAADKFVPLSYSISES